jgi:hypothetical protein
MATAKTKTKTKMRTRTVAILAGIGVAVLGGGIAFAYFTNVGAGSGNAGTGSNNPVVVKQTSSIAGMAPGVAAKPLSGNFDNPNPGPVFVASVTATVTAVTTSQPSPAPSPAVPDCAVSDFLIGGAPATPASPQSGVTTTGLGVEIPAGVAQGAWSGLTLQFNNKPSANQDACKDSTVTITYTAK